MSPIRIAIVGVGKIARDQHVPSISANPDFELVATASRHGSVDGVENFPDIESLLERVKDLDAVALCMPPGPRHAAALTALAAGKHVLLEKPPGATVSELDDLTALARGKDDFPGATVPVRPSENGAAPAPPAVQRALP